MTEQHIKALRRLKERAEGKVAYYRTVYNLDANPVVRRRAEVELRLATEEEEALDAALLDAAIDTHEKHCGADYCEI